MTALRQRLRRILARLLNQRHLAVRAERRYQANRRRAFTAHNEQKRYEAQAELLERKGSSKAAARKRRLAAQAKVRAIKNHKRALYWRAVGEASERRVGALRKDRKALEAEIAAWERKHPTTLQGVDWAWGALDAVALKDAGKHFAMRYLSHDPGKNLVPSEAKSLSAGGILLGVVWETTATRAGEGHAAGVADATEFRRMAKGCGMPAGGSYLFAVDYEAPPSAVDAYFDGAASVLGKSDSGPYGDFAVCKHLMDRGFGRAWQAYAWSYGKWDPRAQLRQFSNGHTLAGVEVDLDCTTTADAGLWRSTL